MAKFDPSEINTNGFVFEPKPVKTAYDELYLEPARANPDMAGSFKADYDQQQQTQQQLAKVDLQSNKVFEEVKQERSALDTRKQAMSPEAKAALDQYYNEINEVIQTPLSASEMQTVNRALIQADRERVARDKQIWGDAGWGWDNEKNQPVWDKQTVGGYTIEWGPANFYLDGMRSDGQQDLKNKNYAWDVYESAAQARALEMGDDSYENNWAITKQMYKDQLIREAYDRRVNAILERAEDRLEDWDGFGDFAESVGVTVANQAFKGFGMPGNIRTENDRNYSSFREQLKGNLSADLKEKQSQFESAYKKTTVTRTSIESLATQLEDLKAQIEKSETKEEFDGYAQLFNSKLDQIRALKSIYDESSKSVLENVDWLERAPTAVDMAGRSYDGLEVFESRFNAWLANTVSGLTTFAEETLILGISATQGLNPDITRMQFKSALSDIGIDQTAAELARETLGEYAKEQEAAVRYRQALTDVESWGDFVDASTDLVGDQIGQVGLMLLTGGTAGTVIMGAAASGSKMNEMISEMENSMGTKSYTPAQFYGSAYLYGAFEAGSEYVTFNQLGRSLKALKAAQVSGAITTDQIRNGFFKSAAKNAANFGVNMAEEGFSEALAQVGQNLTDMYVLENENVKLFDGVDEAFLSGALMSAMMFQAPSAAAGTIRLFNTKSELEKVRINQALIKQYSDRRDALAKEMVDRARRGARAQQGYELNDESAEDALIRKEHADLERSIEDLLTANMAMMYTGIERLDNLTAKEKSDVLYIGNQIEDVKKQIREKSAELRSKGLTAEEVSKNGTIMMLNDELTKIESNLYDVLDAFGSVKERAKAWSSIEAFSLDHGGVPSVVISTADKDASVQLLEFVKSPEIREYFAKRYGEEMADKAVSHFKNELKGYVPRINDKSNTASVFRITTVIDGVEVEMPRIMVSKRGAFRHESMHMTMFNELFKNGGYKLFGTMSETLQRGINALYAANPEVYGPLKRYSESRLNLYRNNSQSQQYIRVKNYIEEQSQRVNTLKERLGKYDKNSLVYKEAERQIEKTNKDIQKFQDFIDQVDATVAEEHMIAITEYMAVTNTKFTPLTGRRFVGDIAEALNLNKGQYDENDPGDMLRMLQTFNKQFDNGQTRRTSKLIKNGKLVKGSREALSNGLRSINSILNNLSNDAQEVSKKAREAADKVNSIYEKEGPEKAAWLIPELYKPMIGKIFLRKGYKSLPNWDFYADEVIQEVMYGETGIMRLVQTFDPSKGVPLSAYINRLLPERLKGVVNSFFDGATFNLDVDELQISESSSGSMDTSNDFSEDFDALSEEDALKMETPAGLKPGYSRVRQRLNLSEKLMNRVRGVVLMNLLFNPDITTRQKYEQKTFLKNLRDNFAKELFDLLKGEGGLFPQAREEWFDFAEKMYDWLITDVPVKTWLWHKVDIFYEKDIDPVTGKQKRLNAEQSAMQHNIGDKYAGNLLWKSKTPTKEEFMSWVKAEGMAYSTIGTRKDMLARALVRQMAFDATLETLTNPVQERFDPQTGDPTGRTVNVFEYWEMMTGEPQDEVKITAQIAVMINRNPNILFNLANPGDDFDIPSFVGSEVNKKVKTREFKDNIAAASGDVSQQKKLAEAYANVIVDVIEANTYDKNKNPSGILNEKLSPTFKQYIVDELLQQGLEEITYENEAWKEAYRAGIKAANARLIKAKEAQKASKKQKEIREAAAAEIEAGNRSAATAEAQGRALSAKWNEFMLKVFPSLTKKQIDAATANSIYNRQPFWKKINSIMSPAAEDFMGLLYWTLGKGQLGDSMREFYTKNLLEPFNRGSSRFDASKVNILNGFRVLNKSFSGLKKTFGNVVFTNSLGRSFSVEDAIKVKLWTNLGYTIPDISQEDLQTLVQVADGIPNVNPYVNGLMALFTKADGGKYEFEKPKEQRGKKGGTREGWSEVPLKLYVSATINGDVRKHHLKEFSRNVDAIFDEYNMNKLAALYGQKYVDALQENINAMKNGRGEFVAKNPAVRAINTWMNGSIASIMFLNARSAVLQLVSTTNYLNWTDNAPWNAIKAFKNPSRFGKSFVELMQSDFMKIRRNSGQIDVDMQDAEDFASSMQSVRGIGKLFAYIARLGYLPTKYADSAAILMGGVPFYINRIDSYMKQGMSEQEAKDKAFDDFRELTENSQQSSRMDKLSSQQRHPVLKMFLAFGNTSGQYSRIIVKSMKDIKNGRGDFKTNVGKILYYAAIQNAIFTAAQNALFRFFLDEDEEDLEKLLASSEFERTMNSMIDNLARGFGVYGALAVVLKNTAYKYVEVTDPEWKKEHFYGDPSVEIIKTASGVMPALSRKVTGVTQLMTNISFHNSMVKKTGDDAYWDENTIEGWAGFTEAFANVPVKRLMQKYDNLSAAYNNDYNMVLRIANVVGWPEWQVDPEGAKARSAAERAEKVGEKSGVLKTKDMTPEQIKENLLNPPSATHEASSTPKTKQDLRNQLLNLNASPNIDEKSKSMSKEEIKKKLLEAK